MTASQPRPAVARSTPARVARDATTPAERPLPIAARVVLIPVLVGGAAVAAPSGFGLFWFVPYAGVGALLAIRRPRTSIGWILLTLGWGFALVTTSIDATPARFASGGVDPLTAAFAVVTAGTGALLFWLLALLAIVFPSGRLPSGRWGRTARACLVATMVMVLAALVAPFISVNLAGEQTGVLVRNPAALLPDLAVWRVLTPDVTILPETALMIAAAVSLVVRYRRTAGVEHLQLRWISAALAFAVVSVVSGFVLGTLLPATADTGLPWIGAIVAFPCIPVAVGVAVLRYRLYEIDRIVSRTIGWAVLSVILGAVFAGLIVGLQALLSPVTEQSTLAVAASTLVAAALFQPLRRRVQHAVDRRFNRSRVDADQAAGAFAAHARSEIDLGTLRAILVGTASDAVHPVAATLWLRQGR